jgi:hypothetical protein
MNRQTAVRLLGFFVLAASVVCAHPGHEDSPDWLLAQAGSPARTATSSAGENRVTIVTNGAYRVITANGLPDHVPGHFPNRGNPNSISAQSYNFRVTLNPQTNATPRPGQGAWFGVALNGVPFEPGTAEFWNGRREWNYEAQSGFIDLGLDTNNAHVQPNGAYHYHGLPTGLRARLGGDEKKMLLVGYAADGFPIYTSQAHRSATDAASPLKRMRSSWQLKKGTRPGGPGGNSDGRFTTDYEYVAGSGDLDECNGRFGVTPEYPQGIYYYCLTEEFPQISRSWRGTPDPSFFKRGPGPRAPGGPAERGAPPRIPGAPPPPPRS